MGNACATQNGGGPEEYVVATTQNRKDSLSLHKGTVTNGQSTVGGAKWTKMDLSRQKWAEYGFGEYGFKHRTQ